MLVSLKSSSHNNITSAVSSPGLCTLCVYTLTTLKLKVVENISSVAIILGCYVSEVNLVH